ncbi:hypothetical protein [Candidatus Mycoplasma haematohominis]|uniref:Uncharacterized protein n=1 Tax=Candidatus Mycoplasma haematohominis TaxID=1494318 RepID=A0A478FSY5_9MOLU|nr:hypothetical protein [Candidatus Mycoplasma haemohominis]GCE63496.1 hypothetical protein MHSWG343_04930 [Candidatus Mycoplasma haemohominis]
MVSTKIAAVLGGGAVFLAVVGYGMSVLFSGIMPDFATLEDQGVTIYDNGNKYVKGFKSFFIDGSFDGNQKWWDWSYNNRWLKDNSDSLKQKAKSKFQGVTGGYKDKDGNETNSLRKKCKDAYDATSSDVEDSAKEDSKFETKDIWRYCSIGGVKPVLASGYDTARFGGKEEWKGKLVSVKNEDKESNDWFWEIREREFRYGVKIKSQLNSEPRGISSEEGKAFRDLYKKTKSGTVKGLCKEIYEELESSRDAKKIDEKDIKKFCFLIPE